jgi:hypothetical protein
MWRLFIKLLIILRQGSLSARINRFRDDPPLAPIALARTGELTEAYIEDARRVFKNVRQPAAL